MAHELEVWLFADRVGTLALIDGRLNFCYAPGWLSHKACIDARRGAGAEAILESIAAGQLDQLSKNPAV